MLHTVLVPLDGSAIGEFALPYACQIAHTTDAKLVLLRAASYHALSVSSARGGRLPVDEARVYLEEQRKKLVLADLEVEVEALHTDPEHAIRFSVRMFGAELIVMTTHARSSVGRAFLGSVAEQVMHHTAIPALLVRLGSRGWIYGGPRHVLVPLDGSPAAESVLAILQDARLLADAELHLVRAVRDPEGGVRNMSKAQSVGEHQAPTRAETVLARDVAQEYLERQAALVEGQCPVSIHVCEGEPADEIRRIAETAHCDLIAMTTTGRTRTDRMLFGTVFEKVFHSTNTPLLAVHRSVAA